MNKLLQQIKNRRIALGMKQHDMMMRIGMSRQQYQRLESKGNPRLDNLELIAKGLNCELLLIPKEKLRAVVAVLEEDEEAFEGNSSLSDDPWQDLLGDLK